MSRKVVGAWFEAFRRQDISLLEIVDDFVHTSPFGDVRGRETYLNLVKENQEAFFSSTIEILDVVENDNKFAVRFLLNENPSCDCIYVRNGKIAEIHSCYHIGEAPTL